VPDLVVVGLGVLGRAHVASRSVRVVTRLPRSNARASALPLVAFHRDN
jgi:hypothetical protein